MPGRSSSCRATSRSSRSATCSSTSSSTRSTWCSTRGSAVPTPEQPDAPDASFVGERPSQGMPVDAGTIEIAAVETGPEVAGAASEGPRASARGSSIGWMVLVVGLRDPGARACRIDDPREIITEIARRGPFADAGTAPGHLLGGDFNGRDMLSRLHLGRAHARSSSRPLAVLIGFVLGGTLGLARRLLPRQGRHRREPAARRVPLDPRGDPRPRAGHDPAHATG